MFDDFTTQVQSDEFASVYDELKQALAEAAEMELAQAVMSEMEMNQAEVEWAEWVQEAFPAPTDEELDVMEREYYASYTK